MFIARFGIKTVDESFYLSVPYRLLNGDAVFTDEWHVSQLSGLLLLLTMKLFLSVVGSTEGIILFFRRWTRFEITAYGDTSASVEKGPLKGIYTAPEMKKNYELVLEDLDYIKSVSDGTLYIADLCPWYYFYTGLDMGTYTAYYVETDGINRNKAYWDLHPDKLPDSVFIPFFDAVTYRFPENTDGFSGSELFGLFDGEVKMLNTGVYDRTCGI